MMKLFTFVLSSLVIFRCVQTVLSVSIILNFEGRRM